MQICIISFINTTATSEHQNTTLVDVKPHYILHGDRITSIMNRTARRAMSAIECVSSRPRVRCPNHYGHNSRSSIEAIHGWIGRCLVRSYWLSHAMRLYLSTQRPSIPSPIDQTDALVCRTRTLPRLPAHTSVCYARPIYSVQLKQLLYRCSVCDG